MSKLTLLINEIKERYVQENFKRIVELINSGTIAGLKGDKGDKGDPGTTPSLSYDGVGKYSSRFNETVTATTIEDALDEIFVFTSVPPSVTLSLNPSAVREKGNTLASIILSTVNIAGNNPVSPLASLIFKRNGATIDTVVNPTGNSSYTDSTPITDTMSWSATLTDGVPRSATSTATLTFLYPILHLVGAVGLTTAQIYSGATKILSATKGRTISFTTANQVAYYAFPAALGVLTSIKDANGFETLPDWTVRSENITGLDGSAQAYKIYEFKNLTTKTMAYTFA